MNVVFDFINFCFKLLINSLVGKIDGVRAKDTCIVEKEVFTASSFQMPLLIDILGNENNNFYPYKARIPSLHVRVFRNAYCYYDLENIFNSRKKIILEYTSQKINPFLGKSKFLFYQNKIKYVNAAVAHLSLSGLENNYYHFTTECLGRFYILKKSGIIPDYYIIAHNLKFQKEFISLLGIKQNQILPNLSNNTLLRVKNLIVPDLINNHEVVFFRDCVSYNKMWVPKWINENFKSINSLTNICSKRIYISRNKSSRRKLINEPEVVDLLKKYQFEVFHLEELSVLDQISLFNNAHLIVSLHGAGLSNIKFSKPNTIIFEIYSQYYHDSSFRVEAVALNLKYYYLIGQTNTCEDVHPRDEDVYISIDILSNSINEILIQNSIQ